ncbi:MAG: hypothetical protein KC466_12540 [Myxococcales bacterium]|nr:hypothetical protein [Myxococcales bacterium]
MVQSAVNVDAPDYPSNLCRECGAPRQAHVGDSCPECARAKSSARSRLGSPVKLAVVRSPLWMALIAATATVLILALAIVRFH